MTKSPHPSSVDKGELLPVTVEARKAACEYLSDIAGLSGKEAVTDIHDEHPALIAFARFERDIRASQAHSLPGDVGTILREMRDTNFSVSGKGAEQIEAWFREKAGNALAALTPSALSEEQQWGGLLEDGLCDDHGQFMCPKCRYPVPSQQGTEP